MSWLARSIANSLKLDDDEEDDHYNRDNAKTQQSPEKLQSEPDQFQAGSGASPSHSPSSTPTSRGVKEDLSELKKTLTRQFWGVASFLAPPPEPSPSHSQISGQNPPGPTDEEKSGDVSEPNSSEEDLIAGIRNDLVEISGKFKTEISKLSGNKTVSEITKIASNLLQFGSEEDSEDKPDAGSAVGVSEEVLAFVRNIAMHPETWLDFPLPVDNDSDDFELSDAQYEHALAVEHRAPALSALRIELCPGYMSEGCFWMIYFVLLHPRLNKHDAELLSTPQVVQARARLGQELKKRSRVNLGPHSSSSVSTIPIGTVSSSMEEHLSVPPVSQKSIVEAATSQAPSDVETEKHPIQSAEIQIVDKPVIEEGLVNQSRHQPATSGSSKVLEEKFEDDGDDWLKEESLETEGADGTTVPIGNDEDVSFSDLEEDDEEMPSGYKKKSSGSDSSTKDSRDWVQLSRSSDDSTKDINSIEITHVESHQVGSHNPDSKESNDWLDVDDIDIM